MDGKTIVLKSSIINDDYTNYVYDSYDIQNREESIATIENNIGELDFDWNIGVIFGGSGSGKTTLLKEFGEISRSVFYESKPLISNYDWLEPDEAARLLSSMGLGSVPSWLRPFPVLSNGEQYRAKLAYVLGKAEKGETTLIDEYTSVVNRDVAKAMSNSLSKYVRREEKKVILASCHYDIIDWLQPDWVYSTETSELERVRWLQRPKIKLQISRCKYETWRLFEQHHYLTTKLNKGATCFLATWDDIPVAFLATLELPNGHFAKYGIKAKTISRVVVLPDFQGLGIGKSLVDYIAKLYSSIGYRTYLRTVNPALGESMREVDGWEVTGGNVGGGKHQWKKFGNCLNRPSYSCRHLETVKYLTRGESGGNPHPIRLLNRPSYKLRHYVDIESSLEDDTRILTVSNKELRDLYGNKK